MPKIVTGFALALAIGALCRWFEVPLPSPTRLTGALLVLAMTVGYMATDRLIHGRRASGATAPAGSLLD